jgi:methionine-rich copper-binding protein CopC
MTGSGSQRWHATRLPILLGLMATTPLWLAQSVWAHANLLRAVPGPSAATQQPPARVTLWFSERIAPDFRRFPEKLILC